MFLDMIQYKYMACKDDRDVNVLKAFYCCVETK